MDHDYSRYLGLVNNCDPDEPLLSETSLGARLSQINLDSVQPADLTHLTQALNVEQLIPTESGLARDYRGIAELMGFSSAEIETRFKRSYNPMKALIDAYIYKQQQQQSTERCATPPGQRISVNKLLKIIEQIERFDVIDDFLPILIRLATPKQGADHKHYHHHHEMNVARESANLSPFQDFDRLTIDDTQNSAAKYDAFVCYAPEDIDHAQDLMAELWNRGKRVATADDLLPGHFEHDALMRLIDLRCRKVIIIVTRNFCRSKECEFQFKFASEVSIKSRDLMIIPVVYEMIPEDLLPGMIRYTSKINLNDSIKSRAMQFERLIRSLDYDPNHTPDSRIVYGNNQTTTAYHHGAQLGFVDSSPRPTRANYSSNNQQMLSNGSTRLIDDSSRRTNDPIVELLYSQESSAITNRHDHLSAQSMNNNTTTTASCNKNALDYNNGCSIPASSNNSSIKWRFPKFRDIFSSLRRDQPNNSSGGNNNSSSNSSSSNNNNHSSNYRHSSSSASLALLISTNSSDLSAAAAADENLQIRELSE